MQFEIRHCAMTIIRQLIVWLLVILAIVHVLSTLLYLCDFFSIPWQDFEVFILTALVAGPVVLWGIRAIVKRRFSVTSILVMMLAEAGVLAAFGRPFAHEVLGIR